MTINFTDATKIGGAKTVNVDVNGRPFGQMTKYEGSDWLCTTLTGKTARYPRKQNAMNFFRTVAEYESR